MFYNFYFVIVFYPFNLVTSYIFKITEFNYVKNEKEEI